MGTSQKSQWFPLVSIHWIYIGCSNKIKQWQIIIIGRKSSEKRLWKISQFSAEETQSERKQRGSCARENVNKIINHFPRCEGANAGKCGCRRGGCTRWKTQPNCGVDCSNFHEKWNRNRNRNRNGNCNWKLHWIRENWEKFEKWKSTPTRGETPRAGKTAQRIAIIETNGNGVWEEKLK